MKRVASAFVLLAVLGISLWNPNPIYFSAFGILAASLALWEFFSLAEKAGAPCYRLIGYPAMVAYLYAFAFDRQNLLLSISALLLIGICFASLIDNWKKDDFSSVLASAGATLFAVLYVAFLAGHLIGVRVIGGPVKGPQLLSLFFLVIAAGDSGAYYVGRSLGKHKLAPKISPGKTIQGSIGGILGSILSATLCRYLFYPDLPLHHALGLGLVFNIVGQAGDLFESMLKRGSGAKDAASIIPGHGGLLDRLDSIVFNAPILYYYLIIFT